MACILVTGGCGYIGSHAIVDLILRGYEVVCADNLSRTDGSAIKGVEKITNTEVVFRKVDFTNEVETEKLFSEFKFDGVIHFAAFKSVEESMRNSLLYFRNNIDSLLTLLAASKKYEVKNFIFSSSCSVYGNVSKLPVTEQTPMNKPESPYAASKQICEAIIQQVAKSSEQNFILLRYFNPAGAHESALIGESVMGKATNLVPNIAKTALGLKDEFIIYGNDYATRDGTCIRDYIHVMDVAHAHALAFQYLEKNKQESNFEVFNLGSGTGVTVKEMVNAFENVTGTKLNYSIGERRPGDIISIYADNSLANKKLNWQLENSLEQIMYSAWLWEKNNLK